ncbi:MAG TPA: hypothetical protein VM243_08855 [Phycisphaerae bacterium]|nr:hypothetical protein [Phycisphaerae bacterium]
MSRFGFTVSAVLVALTLAGGCSRSRGKAVCAFHPSIGWDDVATERVQPVEDGFVNLAPGGTDGLFPASIAVARITVGESEGEGAGGAVVLDMTPANDFLSWNTRFDNLRYISEVFPLNWHDLGENDPSAGQIVSAAAELAAGLCLVYGRGDVSENEAEVRGLLYQARTGRPLAAIHARAAVPEPGTIDRPPEYVRGDHRHCDPRYLADVRFERLVLDCVRQLREGDRPVIVEPPEGWTPREPTELRVWPPPPFGKPQ